MTWTARVAIGIGALMLVSVAYLAYRHHNEELRREMHATAQLLKDEVDRRFPIGAAQSDVVVFLHSQSRGFHESEGSNDYWLSIGQEPSGVWYCGPMEVGMVAQFKDHRLLKTEVWTWGLNCV
jgi:hypothetical protein